MKKLPLCLGLSLVCLPSAFPLTVSAATSLSNFVEWTGEAADHFSGFAMTSGDLNGDGYEDTIIGSLSGGDNEGGAVYIVYGQADTIASQSLAQFTTLSSPDSVGQAGYALATGDVNNDGYDDLLIGSPYSGDDMSLELERGAVYLVYGQAASLSSGLLSDYIQFTGEGSGEHAGSAVASGDLNGDGYDDIVVGAMGNDDGGTDAGAVYLIPGKSSTFVTSSLSYRVQLTGEAAGDNVGSALATGDVNNDGYDDLCIGAYGNNDAGSDAGAAYLWYGASGSLSGGSLSSRVQFTGEAAGDQAGVAVALGDANGDSYADLLIGANLNSDASTHAGAVYFIPGKSNTFGSSSLSIRVQYVGATAADKAGGAVALADINGDGYQDLLVGAIGNDTAASNAGAVYFIAGKTGQFQSGTLYTRVTYTGVTTSDYAGGSIVAVDANNDQFAELLIGAVGNDDGGSDSGAVYLGYVYVDADQDGVAGAAGLFNGGDCSDTDSTVSAFQTYYRDADGDGYGTADTSIVLCSMTAPTNYVTNADDDNDDDYDNDGTSTEDDCDDTNSTIAVEQTYYQDSDSDGLGNAVVTTSICSLTAPTGYVINSSDDDDTVASGDSDNDDDGVNVDSDCNDADATVSEYQTYYRDADADGYGNPDLSTAVCSATPPNGYVANHSDTDDADSTVVYTDISSVAGTTDGDILVTYPDDSTQQYDIFTITTSKETIARLVPDTTLIVVVHPTARKIALVNGLVGNVYTTKTLNSSAHSKIKLVIKDLRSDDTYEAVVVAKRKNKLVHVHMFTIKVTAQKLKLRDDAMVKHKKIVPSKTKVKPSQIRLRRASGKVVKKYTVTKKYRLR